MDKCRNTGRDNILPESTYLSIVCHRPRESIKENELAARAVYRPRLHLIKTKYTNITRPGYTQASSTTRGCQLILGDASLLQYQSLKLIDYYFKRGEGEGEQSGGRD
ncbi:hypothetical protein RRG08_055316 [Elysia crispata]|uniref:Uncharacterized protein n=1 Tax=Elysia crispata TaxID=231223 RepID=A0AAE1AQL8_9GAST|nr:hypothetical protein RRG08_055316 [Elysia crispata]